MRERILLKEYQLYTRTGLNRFKRQSLQQAQDVIYQFLLEIVKKDSPSTVLLEFKRLFLFCDSTTDSDVIQALYTILFKNNENEFKNTLKRSSYILINNWSSKRQYHYIQKLIQLFNESTVTQHTLSPSLARLRSWITNFINSEGYQELQLFALHYTSQDQDKNPWSYRYTSYLLVPQYLNSKNPIEQREMARTLSKRLKEKFKFELALYASRCDSPAFKEENVPNPTSLGSGVIRLIKKIISRPLLFSHVNYANIFIRQTKNINYKDFKQSLHNYLIFPVANKTLLEGLNKKLCDKLENLYGNHDQEPVSRHLFLRTCRRIIDFLTIEDGSQPSLLFVLLITQGNPLTIVIILLKIILICKYVHPHLDYRIAQLIRYYENYPEAECQWFINFLEIFNIVFTIYTANVQYNLVKVKNNAPNRQHVVELDTYRVFSQLKGADLRGVDLSGADLTQADLNAADLRGANLSGADLTQADLSLAKLSQANLSNAILNGANLIAADLNGADLSGAMLSGAKLRRANLRQAKLSSASLTATKLYCTDLRQAVPQPVDLSDANLSGADLSHTQLLHANLKGANLYQANLSDANLSGANLARANLNRAKLNHVNLHGADLNDALLRCATLSDAGLSRANLSHADLSCAKLNNVDLSSTDLSYALLRHVNLSGANLSRANLRSTNLFDANLSFANVQGALFRENSGLSEEAKLELKERKAILEIAPD